MSASPVWVARAVARHIEAFTQLATGTVQTHLGGGDRDPEFGRNGFVGEVVDVAQDDDGSELDRKGGQRRCQAVTVGHLHRTGLRIVLRPHVRLGLGARRRHGVE